MFDVVSIATARLAARELALIAVPALHGAAQGARDGARPAPDVQNLAIDAVAQHHDAGIAGHAAGRLPAEVKPAGLLDDGQAGVQVRVRRNFRGKREPWRQPPAPELTYPWRHRCTEEPRGVATEPRILRTGPAAPPKRYLTWCSGPDELQAPHVSAATSGAACAAVVGSSAAAGAGRPRFRATAPCLAGGLAGGERVRLHVHGHLEAVRGVARIEPAGQRAVRHQPERIGPPLRNRDSPPCALAGTCSRAASTARSSTAPTSAGSRPRSTTHAVLVHLHAQRPARQQHLLGIGQRIAIRSPPPPYQPLHVRGGGAQGHPQQPRSVAGVATRVRRALSSTTTGRAPWPRR